MDPVTQGLLGAAASQACMRQALGRHAWWLGALGGMAADLDIFIRSPTDPLLFYFYHRHFTHSLGFIPIGGLLVGLVILLIVPKLRLHKTAVCLATSIGYATHALLDACTMYGTVLYWPFSLERVSWDIIAIIDPIFTGILLLGVIVTEVTQLRKPIYLALGLAMGYLLLGVYQHQRALDVQAQLIQARGEHVTHRRVTPQLATNTAWRLFYKTNNKIYLDDAKIPLFKPPIAEPGISLPYAREFNAKKYQRDWQIFVWFTDGYISQVSTDPIIFIDARYIVSYHPLTALWGIRIPKASEDRDHVYWDRIIR